MSAEHTQGPKAVPYRNGEWSLYWPNGSSSWMPNEATARRFEALAGIPNPGAIGEVVAALEDLEFVARDALAALHSRGMGAERLDQAADRARAALAALRETEATNP